MTIDSIAAQCFLYFGAGFDTSSSTLGFLMLELALHQDIQDKVRNEVNTVIANNAEGLTYEILSEMTYVDMVISGAYSISSIHLHQEVASPISNY